MLINLQKIQMSYQELGTPASIHKNSNTIGSEMQYQKLGVVPDSPIKVTEDAQGLTTD